MGYVQSEYQLSLFFSNMHKIEEKTKIAGTRFLYTCPRYYSKRTTISPTNYQPVGPVVTKALIPLVPTSRDENGSDMDGYH